MQSQTLQPNVITYISDQFTRKDLVGSESLARTPADLSTQPAVFSAYGKGWMATRTLQLFETMRLQEWQPVMIT